MAPRLTHDGARHDRDMTRARPHVVDGAYDPSPMHHMPKDDVFAIKIRSRYSIDEELANIYICVIVSLPSYTHPQGAE